MMICDFIETYWNGVLLFRGLIVFVSVVTILAIGFRANNENWDISFIWKTYFVPELFNWRKYGVFSFLLLAAFGLLIAAIFITPTIMRVCNG